MMKRTIFCLLGLVLFASCEDSVNLEEVSLQSIEPSLIIEDNILKPGLSGILAPPELPLCDRPLNLQNITSPTYWYILDNPAGFIDYELERIFNNSIVFNQNLVQHLQYPGPVVLDEEVTISFYEEPSVFNPLNGEFDYFYLSSPITPTNANKLKTYFACQILDYQDENHSGSFVYDVNFYGDAGLCGDCGIYLTVKFKLGHYGTTSDNPTF